MSADPSGAARAATRRAGPPVVVVGAGIAGALAQAAHDIDRAAVQKLQFADDGVRVELVDQRRAFNGRLSNRGEQVPAFGGDFRAPGVTARGVTAHQQDLRLLGHRVAGMEFFQYRPQARVSKP